MLSAFWHPHTRAPTPTHTHAHSHSISVRCQASKCPSSSFVNGRPFGWQKGRTKQKPLRTNYQSCLFCKFAAPIFLFFLFFLLLCLLPFAHFCPGTIASICQLHFSTVPISLEILTNNWQLRSLTGHFNMNVSVSIARWRSLVENVCTAACNELGNWTDPSPCVRARVCV